MSANALSSDLDYILEHTASLWEEIRQQRIFITGGTGFFGCWLLESFLWANQKLHLQANAVVLTRNSDRFAQKFPHLHAQPALRFHTGDIDSFIFPEGSFSHVIHAAGDAAPYTSAAAAAHMENTMIAGTIRVLDFAVASGARKFLLTSSGAVYGRQPPTVSHITEDYPLQTIEVAKSAYINCKRSDEQMCCAYASQHPLEVKIARCFAFVGPYLPLNSHYAIANFIRDGINGGPIIIHGDGTAFRSYLYAADLMIWLWTILFRGISTRPYNVGSNLPISIAELASVVADCFQPKPAVNILQLPREGILPERYVPSIDRARNELGLMSGIKLADGIRHTKSWCAENSTRSDII